MAQIIALVYNWWNIFCRLADGNKHMEARTSRPMFQNIIGRICSSGNGRYVNLACTGSSAKKILIIFQRISSFLNKLCLTATQLTNEEKWKRILEHAFRKYLKNKPLKLLSEGNQLLLGI